MNLHLVEIATEIAPGKHAVLLLDQAGWHLSSRLVIPPNITILPLPTKCPELNPQENVWQFLRDNWLSNRVFNVWPARLQGFWRSALFSLLQRIRLQGKAQSQDGDSRSPILIILSTSEAI